MLRKVFLSFALLTISIFANAQYHWVSYSDYNRIGELTYNNASFSNGPSIHFVECRFATIPHYYSPLQFSVSLLGGKCNDGNFGRYSCIGIGFDPRYYLSLSRIETFVGINIPIIIHLASKTGTISVPIKNPKENDADWLTIPYVGANYFFTSHNALTVRIGLAKDKVSRTVFGLEPMVYKGLFFSFGITSKI